MKSISLRNSKFFKSSFLKSVSCALIQQFFFLVPEIIKSNSNSSHKMKFVIKFFQYPKSNGSLITKNRKWKKENWFLVFNYRNKIHLELKNRKENIFKKKKRKARFKVKREMRYTHHREILSPSKVVERAPERIKNRQRSRKRQRFWVRERTSLLCSSVSALWKTILKNQWL